MNRLISGKDISSGQISNETTIKSREDEMISLAMDLAEQKLRDGTASSQLITHYLKLATTQQQLEMEKLERENELLRAKTEAIQAQRSLEETYKNAIAAMQVYQGNLGSDENDPDIF